MTTHLLIVDDDTHLCRTLERVATLHLATEVLTAHDVPTAFERVEAIPLDAPNAIVLSDLDLRDARGDGVDVLLHARERRPHARLVLMSGQEPEALARASAAAGAHATLQKPFGAGALLDALRRALDAGARLQDDARPA